MSAADLRAHTSVCTRDELERMIRHVDDMACDSGSSSDGSHKSSGGSGGGTRIRRRGVGGSNGNTVRRTCTKHMDYKSIAAKTPTPTSASAADHDGDEQRTTLRRKQTAPKPKSARAADDKLYRALEKAKLDLAAAFAERDKKLAAKDVACSKKMMAKVAECNKKLAAKDEGSKKMKAECNKKMAAHGADCERKLAANDAEWRQKLAAKEAACKTRLAAKGKSIIEAHNKKIAAKIMVVEKQLALHKRTAETAEELSKYYEEETATMQIFSSKQTDTIDRLKELALLAGVDASIVADAGKV